MRGGLTAALVLLLASVAGAQPECAESVRANTCLPPDVQTIAAGGTVADDGCGGFKRLTAGGTVTTSTTDTFTAPSSGNRGCVMHVCNVGANQITLDSNANFTTASGASIALGTQDCVVVASDGTVWRQVSALVNNVVTTTSTSTTTSST